MTNKYNIPKELEAKIRKKYSHCVFCGIKLKDYYPEKGNDKATIEHIDNNGPLNKEENIVMCCNSCNSSKGIMNLKDWLETDYCKKKKIKENMAEVIRNWMRKEK